MLALVASPEVGAEQPTLKGLQQQLQRRDRKIEEQDRIIRDLARRLELLERQATAASALAASPSPPVKPRVAEATPQPTAPAQANGGARGTRLKVDEEAAERALDRTLVVQGALLLPFKQAEIQPTFDYTRVEANNSFATTVNGSPTLVNERVKRNAVTPSLQLRAGLPWDSQFQFGIPYNVVDQEVVQQVPGEGRLTRDKTGSAFGDVSLGLAKTVLREGSWWPDLIARLTYNSGSGQKLDNGVPLDAGFSSISGQLVALKRQDPLAFVASTFYRNTFPDNHVRPGNRLGFSLGANLASSPETSLSLSLQQTFVDDLKVRKYVINDSDQVQSNLVFGASSILGRNVLLDVSGGVGLTSDAPDYFVEVALPIRFDVPRPAAASSP
jgi:hypothetical protein